ncbi:MAG TPA: helix-turn-helix transcriptional regulator [Candidatus Goldiibacteriota bacterium]|nr:helix-turn-helix transcriptional regulator [Candidatus Goldiibacteriota bacterium]
MPPIMARKSKLILAPLNSGKESFGNRLSRIRKSKGFTQVELAEKMGIIQVLISDYERDKLRPHHDMVARFAQALDVSADELLGIKLTKSNEDKPSLRIAQRLKKIEGLPPAQQKTLLKTIDTFIKAAQT